MATLLGMDLGRPPVVGQGRASVVYDLGDGTVLRQYRNPSASAEREAEAMRWAARAGVPVPAVHAVDSTGIVMDRVDGPTMMTALADQPGQAVRFGVLLADLHRRLDVTAADGAAHVALVHGDLHPDNVLMSAGGPVIIDWTNFRVGPRSLDLALTWIVLACFQPDGQELRVRLEPTRAPLLAAFVESIDMNGAKTYLHDAASIRRADPATTQTEQECIARLVAEAAAGL